MTSNQRQYPRYAVEVVVDIAAGDQAVTGRSKNVSQGGFCALANAPLVPGQLVSVRLALVFDEDSFSEPLTLPARVAWCTKLDDAHQVGCSFSNLSEDQSRYLQMFLRFLEADDDTTDDESDPFS